MATRALQTLETLAAPGGLIKASSFVVEIQNGRTGLLLAFYKGGVAWCVVHTVSPALGRPTQEEFQAVLGYIANSSLGFPDPSSGWGRGEQKRRIKPSGMVQASVTTSSRPAWDAWNLISKRD